MGCWSAGHIFRIEERETRKRQLFFSLCVALTNTSRQSGVSMVTGCQAGCWERRRKKRSRPAELFCVGGLSVMAAVRAWGRLLLGVERDSEVRSGTETGAAGLGVSEEEVLV